MEHLTTCHFLVLFFLVLVGFALGIFYFAGLWWTLKRLPCGKHWGLRMFSSFLIRAAVLVAAIDLFMAGNCLRLPALVLGFTLARLLMVRRAAPLPVNLEPRL